MVTPAPILKATHQQTKAHNTRLILKTVYDHGQISRADVARATHLTRTTVSDVVSSLIEQGLVKEVGPGPSTGGKQPTLLRVVENSRFIIGVDLASTAFRGAIVNLRGEVQYEMSRTTKGLSGHAALDLVYELIDSLIAQHPKQLLGIGIGAPGLIDTRSGVIHRAVNLDWRDLPLKSLLEQRIKLPIFLDNDSHAAALAEYTFGGERNSSNLVVIKIGEGVGAGIVLNGHLFQGDGFGAGEIGHVAVVENGHLCRCGNRGCLETVSSLRAIVQGARAIAQNDPHSFLHRYASQPEAITPEIVADAMRAGDESVQQMLLDIGHYLGIAIANLVGILNIHKIVIAGNAADFGPIWLPPIREEMEKRSLATMARATHVEVSTLGADIVILGASTLVLAHELGTV